MINPSKFLNTVSVLLTIKNFILLLVLISPSKLLIAQSVSSTKVEYSCLELLNFKDEIVENYLADSSVKEHEKIMYSLYLDCAIETIAIHYSCADIAVKSLLTYGDLNAIFEMSDDKISDYFTGCYNEKLGSHKFSDLGEEGYKMLSENCHEMIEANSNSFKDISPLKFCDCLSQKIISRGFTYSYYNNEFLDEISDESSVIYNEIYLNCYYNSPIELNTENHSDDIFGPDEVEEIDIFNYGTRKVKLLIGDEERYFDLDTGAEETVVTKKMAEKLEKDGSVTRYLEEEFFTLADGSRVLCRQMVINNIQIGNFSVNNVTVVVPIEGQGSFLLGLSFLNKFIWSIDSENSKLVLQRK